MIERTVIFVEVGHGLVRQPFFVDAVVEEDRLVGIVALKDLLELISLKLQIESPGRG